MSRISLAPNASGTGTLTISAPNTNTDRAIALPDAAGTVFVSGQALSATTGSFSGTVSGGSTIGVGGATPAASGAGITFPAAVSASSNANTLDDYEEGTWTPAIGGTWTSNPTGLGGHYTKIGRFVTAYLEFVGGTKASSVSGYFTGLPFNTDIHGTGAATDSNVTNNGLALAANANRIWLTGTSFGSTNYVVVTYMTST